MRAGDGLDVPVMLSGQVHAGAIRIPRRLSCDSHERAQVPLMPHLPTPAETSKLRFQVVPVSATTVDTSLRPAQVGLSFRQRCSTERGSHPYSTGTVLPAEMQARLVCMRPHTPYRDPPHGHGALSQT